MKQALKAMFRRMPYLSRILESRDRLRVELDQTRAVLSQALESHDRLRAEIDEVRAKSANVPHQDEPPGPTQLFPPGHYFSPLPDLSRIRAREARLFDRSRREVPGIDLNESAQRALFETFAPYFPEARLPAHRQPPLRYYHQNDFYPLGDAIFLYCLMRHRQPKRLIEVGSGFSSCVILDTNEFFLGGQTQCTFIEPYPERLLGLLPDADRERIHLIRQPLEEVPLDLFRGLEAGDILFIDSTHVSKVGSDVNYLFFEILPALRPGVAVHIHDVFHPFEYPAAWVYEGRAWSEIYLLRAFLQYNSAFRILFFNSYWFQFDRDLVAQALPGGVGGGGSLWLERT